MPLPSAESPKSVLVIEDDDLISGLLVRVLEREGYQVQLINDGHAALAHIQSEPPPDLVLLDLLLPFTDGLSLLDVIAKAPAWSGTPVIVLSGKIQEDQIGKALALGATDYITKPFQLGELLARVNRALKQK